MKVEIKENVFTEMCKMRDAYRPNQDIIEFINDVLHNEYEEEY
ncbi:MAG: hypothetical protein R6W84_04135 [Promethearchaeia archaeon]